MMPQDIPMRRRSIAVFLVIGLFLALGFSKYVEANASEAAGEQGVLLESIQGQSNVNVSDVSVLLDQVEKALGQWDDNLPAGFEVEVGLLPGAFDIRVSAHPSNCVVGYSLYGTADEIQQNFEESMGRQGWSAVPLGGAEGATFIKEGGRYEWVLETCTQVGDKTSVVVRCMTSDGGLL